MKKTHGITLGLLIGLACLGTGINNAFDVKQVNAETEQIQVKLDENTAKTLENTQNGVRCRAKSAYLMDFGTETPMFAKNEREHLPIASMCKIMTLALCFDAIKSGHLSFDEEIQVSETASSMGGSQVFLEANAKYPVKELIKSIIVCSANDSCVAMAEKIAGCEEAFVEKMNEKAQKLGCNDTLFANCTGLPKEPQYSCAKDVAIMLKEVLKHPEYYEFSKVWMDKFQHPEGRFTEITNTNKLVRFYDGCDGGKTGFTNQAGFCLAATAKKGGMRVISVVIGEENSTNRFEDVKGMFNYAFANYDVKPVIKEGEALEQTACIKGGTMKTVKIAPMRSAYAFLKRGDKSCVSVETTIYPLRAPVNKGQTVGELTVFDNGVERERIPLIALDSVEKAGFSDAFRDIARGWTGRN